MIQIPDPPTVSACATCMSPISWCYSARNRSWFSVIRIDDDTMRIHRCRLSGAPSVVSWRQVRHGTPPTAEYVEARRKIQDRTEEKT